MAKSADGISGTVGRAIPDIGIVSRFVRKLRRYRDKSDFDLDSPNVWEKSRYSAALFGFMFFDGFNGKRLDEVAVTDLEFVVLRSLNEIEQQRADFYVACLMREWTRKGWIVTSGRSGTMTLTRDGTEQITKVNAGRRGGIVFAQGPVSERGRLRIVSILCRTVVWLTVIIAFTLMARDVIGIAGNVVETVTDPVQILRKIPGIGRIF